MREETDQFQRLRAVFWSDAPRGRRIEAAQELVLHHREQAFALFSEGLGKGRLEEAVRGFAVLEDPRAIPLLLRVFHGRGGSPKELDALVRALAALEAIEPLCAIAEDRYCAPSVRFAVLQALTAYPHERVKALFLAELEASHLARQQLAILTLGRWQVVEAVPLLCRRLRAQMHTSLREPIVYALAEIATPEALTGLQELLFHDDPQIRAETAEQVAQFSNGELLPLLQGCLLSLEGHPDEQERVREALEQFQRDIDHQFDHRIKPWVGQMEDALFQD